MPLLLEGGPPLDVWFALPSGSLILDWAGPAEALRFANTEGPGAPYFRLRFAAPQPESATSVGAQLAQLEPLPEKLTAPAWIVVVGKAGPETERNAEADDRAVAAWLGRLRPGSDERLRLITICSGALLAAQAGLLGGRLVTTHHLDLDLLRQLAPSARVVEDRVFVIDGALWSSAGVTAGIDLALHLVSAHCGALVAARVAQRMAVALRRGPNDPQLSPFLAHRQHLNARLHKVQDAIAQAPRETWDAARMADLAATTPRSLNRLFAEHAGTTPLAYVRGLRVALARSALEAGSSVARAAELSGFSSDLQLRRAWAACGAPGLPSGRRSPAAR
jgi:transcriptional regulator GlxA family with amidase domain